MTTWPAVAASIINTTDTIAANRLAMTSFAPRYTPAGMGNARFSSSRPRSRSIARLTPRPNNPGAMTPNVVKLASR